MARREAAGAFALAGALAYVAFRAKGGTELERTTEVLALAVLAGGAMAAAAVLFTPRSRPAGALTAAAFVLLALLTGLSIEWSVAPGESWIEANRTLAYGAVFIGAIALGNIGPRLGVVVLGGILLAAMVVVAYALASRVWPAELAELDLYARIGQPFAYWNAVGVTAAIALPGTLWLGARRDGPAALNALAYPAAGLAVVALFLTYSRSATLAAAVALGLWLLFVPLRLRSTAILLAAGAAAAPVVVWASNRAAFTDDGLLLPVREEAGTPFGLRLLALVIVLYAAGLALNRMRPRLALGEGARMRIGRVLVGLLAVAALAGVVAVAASDRGLTGTIADRWDDLTEAEATTPGGPTRLGTTASSRSRYWGYAIDVFEQDPVAGAGAGGFSVAALRFRDDQLMSRHAHGYALQTLADLGVIGLLMALALALTWLVAALRALGATPRSQLGQLFLIGRPERVDHDRAPAWTADRFVITALFLAALAYGIQSFLDWTWFVPGPTVMALLAAGFVVGRGPAPEAVAAPEARPRLSVSSPRVLLAVLAALTTLAVVWSVLQPNRAERVADDALVLAGAGQVEEALEKARDAQDINPLAVKPLFAEAAVHQRAGRDDEALAVFQRAVEEHPRDPQAWLRLADFQLYELDQAQEAVAALDRALYLDPMSEAARDSFIEARTRLRTEGVLPPEPPAPVPAPEAAP